MSRGWNIVIVSIMLRRKSEDGGKLSLDKNVLLSGCYSRKATIAREPTRLAQRGMPHRNGAG
jgi:hypothetical protein